MISPTYKNSMIYDNSNFAHRTNLASKIKALRQARRVGKKKARFRKLGAEEEAEEEHRLSSPMQE